MIGKDVRMGQSLKRTGEAYESNESGDRFEVFVRPFPNVGGRREKVSIDGGRYPLWGPKGSNELFYVDLNGGMVAASVELSPSLSLGLWQNTRGAERRDRHSSGEVEAVELADPACAWLSGISGRGRVRREHDDSLRP
jgi:hypothetical protein